MDSARQPSDVDGQIAEFLASHVGQRVVIRRALLGETGPSGGQAFTDVVGGLVSNDPVTVELRDGSQVSFDASLIVAAKAVPPPPPAPAARRRGKPA